MCVGLYLNHTAAAIALLCVAHALTVLSARMYVCMYVSVFVSVCVSVCRLRHHGRRHRYCAAHCRAAAHRAGHRPGIDGRARLYACFEFVMLWWLQSHFLVSRSFFFYSAAAVRCGRSGARSKRGAMVTVTVLFITFGQFISYLVDAAFATVPSVRHVLPSCPRCP